MVASMSRRANGEGSIYQRKDGRWTGAVYVLNRDGGRQRRQVYGKTRAEVAGKVADLLSLNRKHIPAAPVEVTVQQYAQSWLERLGASASWHNRAHDPTPRGRPVRSAASAARTSTA